VKNIAISKNGSTKTVSHQDLIDVMVPNYEYTVEEVVDLLPDSPKTSVRDTLMSMVDRGIVWRNASQSRIKFALLEGERLQEAVERKTTRLEVPAWMTRDLIGYTAAQNAYRELCMTVRK
jgi:hypothetical protein